MKIYIKSRKKFFQYTCLYRFFNKVRYFFIPFNFIQLLFTFIYSGAYHKDLDLFVYIRSYTFKFIQNSHPFISGISISKRIKSGNSSPEENLFLNSIQRFFSIFKGYHIVIRQVTFNDLFYPECIDFIIVNNTYALYFAHVNLILNVVPFPGSLSTATDPPSVSI